MVRHARQWFGHSTAVEMVINGVLRTLWVGTWVQWVVSQRALARSIDDHILPRAKHAALTGINGSLAGINVEVPACFSTPKKRANVRVRARAGT